MIYVDKRGRQKVMVDGCWEEDEEGVVVECAAALREGLEAAQCLCCLDMTPTVRYMVTPELLFGTPGGLRPPRAPPTPGPPKNTAFLEIVSKNKLVSIFLEMMSNNLHFLNF